MMFSNPNPTCEKDCRFRENGPSTTTAMYFPPTYDKYGNNTNPDGNITSGQLVCSTCGGTWSYSIRYGETNYVEIVAPNCSMAE